jgi:gas vesicle protein
VKEEEMRYEENDYETSSGSWLLTFILGGLIGAAVALLVAPKSGRQTREQLKDVAQDAKEKAGGYYDQAKSKVTDAVQKSAEVLHHKKSETTKATTEA